MSDEECPTEPPEGDPRHDERGDQAAEDDEPLMVDPATGEPQEGGGVFGPRPDEGDDEILPGEPDVENVAFLLLGVAASLLVVADLVGVL